MSSADRVHRATQKLIQPGLNLQKRLNNTNVRVWARRQTLDGLEPRGYRLKSKNAFINQSTHVRREKLRMINNYWIHEILSRSQQREAHRTRTWCWRRDVLRTRPALSLPDSPWEREAVTFTCMNTKKPLQSKTRCLSELKGRIDHSKRSYFPPRFAPLAAGIFNNSS